MLAAWIEHRPVQMMKATRLVQILGPAHGSQLLNDVGN
jgi:hypothetical protein